ncbi:MULTISPECIES: DinB family protein [Deinococcus]|uniref:DinB family protein n=1 Tax=Deinococcus rufus TaxID=2136097 RepID=A0ABV7Z445_9DEIO|nr:DinB family protein [Deinococcus sp. AB2017081]WQE96615.1 DinB family protein [Deinococcus sp. AB2017081]
MQLPDLLEVLRRTPGTLDALLRDLGDDWTRLDEGEGTWNPREVVAHLLHAEQTNWWPRLHAILHGDGVFPPFDRHAHLSTHRDTPLNDLLDAFAVERARSLRTLEDHPLSTSTLERTGQHPEFGTVTAAQLLATWAAHDLDHLAQITRTLAGGLQDDVGPWQAYLRVLRGS